MTGKRVLIAMDQDFMIRRAEAGDLDAICSMMEEVKAGMEHPEWYLTDSREWVGRHLEEEGFILLAETPEGVPAAFFMVDFPAKCACQADGAPKENLGADLQFSEADLKRVVHMDSAAVCPAFRGHRLQGRLLEAVERELVPYPECYYFCTVHPDNYASLSTMQCHGYVIVRTKEKYGGLPRHVLYKKKEPVRPRVLVSACLLGVNCRYNEKGVLEPEVRALMDVAELVPVCPEICGGLATPREPAERAGGRVLTKSGRDVTVQYQKGAEESLKLARLYGCACAVLKERSPSCGSGRVYDGTHTGTLTDGDGMTAQLLKEYGIPVFGESQTAACHAFLCTLKN